MSFSPVRKLGRALQKVSAALLASGSLEGVWIDVGAHRGESTFGFATRNPKLLVYAFEPNLRVAMSLVGRAMNFIVVPMAVAEQDGHSRFYVNQLDDASSLLPMDEEARKLWKGGDRLGLDSIVEVPTIRLDSFMDSACIKNVDFLKVDAQGMDLAVVKSAGSRLDDISRIRLEVDVAPHPLYQGSSRRSEVVSFLQNAGFQLEGVERQTAGQEENLTFTRRRD